MTLESWSMGIVRPVMQVFPHAWLFFVPFIVITTFAVLHLFVGRLLIVAACGMGVLRHAGLINSAEYPLLPLTRTSPRPLGALPIALEGRIISLGSRQMGNPG